MHPIFLELFKGMPQGAPGDDESSEKAFSLLNDLPDYPDILDVGCGTGRHTLLLSRLSNGNITALDLLEQNIEILNSKLEKSNLKNRVKTLLGDMKKMPFKNEQFNLIWSEGSIYVIGFKKGLQKWKKFLKPDGYLVVTDMVWVREDPPEELKSFFYKEYPGMLLHSEALDIAKRENYKITGSFPVSLTGWENYYNPMEQRIIEMRQKYQNNKEALAIFDSFEREIEIFKKFKNYIEYMFFIFRKKEELYIRSMCGVRRKI